MPTRFARGALALLATAAIGLTVATTPGQAGSGKCSSSGQAVITQMQQVIYFVPSKNEYRGCYAKTGKVTRLVSRGFSARGVVAHGTHATILESPDDAPFAADVETWQLSLWNVKTGKRFRAHTIEASADEPLQLVDDVLGDPVTAIEYTDADGTRVLDVIYDKGAKRLSKGKVKLRSTKVSGRKITWTEGGKKRSKKV